MHKTSLSTDTQKYVFGEGKAKRLLWRRDSAGFCRNRRSINKTNYSCTPSDTNIKYFSETCTIRASDARRITAAEMKYMRRTAGYTWDRLQNKCTNCTGVKNNTNFVQITGIQEKLDTTCK